MTIAWSDIVKVATKEQIVDRFIGLLRLAGFPVASWHSGSFQKHTVETEGELFADLSLTAAKIAMTISIKKAVEIGDEWVDLCAEFFDEERQPAVFTRGQYRLTDVGGVGPVTIQPGQFWVANADKSLRFVNVDAAPKVLPLNGYVDLTVQAESPGADWNVGSGALTELLTPLPGAEGINLALASGTWITQQGTNRESSARLAQRCIDKWSTLGAGSDEPAYRYRATTASPEVIRVRAYSPGQGAVRVVVAGESGPVSAAALAAAATAIERKRPLGVPDVTTSNATVVRKTIAGTLFTAKSPDIVLASAQASVDRLQRATAIAARVSRERIVASLMIDDVDDLELSSLLTDFQLGPNEIWAPVYELDVQAA